MYEKRAGQDVSDRMSDYRERVEVDFDVDPKAIAYIPFNTAVDEPPFKVIRHRRKLESHFEGAEPNRLIWSYLHGEYRSSTQPTTVPTASPSAK
ncbi:MAG: hypothetical protein H7Z14_16815 [Anaerolineae bacterium]|nr:hypothetical protein [Phycisphaerae bacterium]